MYTAAVVVADGKGMKNDREKKREKQPFGPRGFFAALLNSLRPRDRNGCGPRPRGEKRKSYTHVHHYRQTERVTTVVSVCIFVCCYINTIYKYNKRFSSSGGGRKGSTSDAWLALGRFVCVSPTSPCSILLLIYKSPCPSRAVVNNNRVRVVFGCSVPLPRL